MGEALELVRREGYERYVPLPEDVSGPDGVSVGVSVKDVQTSIPTSPDAGPGEERWQSHPDVANYFGREGVIASC